MGTASIDGMPADRFLTAVGQEVHVAPATRIYKIVGHSIDVTTLFAIATNMRAVPRS